MSPTSDAKIKANRANARASTGPKTRQGRRRSAGNAVRHAMSLSVYSDAALAEQVAALAREISGTNGNPEIQELARRVAEAEIDLRRVREARHQLLSQAVSNPYYGGRANVTAKLADMRQLLRDDAVTTVPEEPHKVATILSHEIKRLSVMERYERRALSRRKFAIRALDLARIGVSSI